MRRALCINDNAPESSVSGIGRHLGINISWSVHWRSDGAFYEEINGKELSFLWGHDGRPDSSCWEVDTSGVSRSLEYDDHEAVLASTWVRTGTWLRPQITDQLELELEVPSCAEDGFGAASSSCSSDGPQQDQSQVPPLHPSKPQPENRASPNSSLSFAASNPEGSLSMKMKLKGGRLVNTVTVCTRTWVVQSLQQPLCGDMEMWHFGAWRPWTADMRVLYPSDLIHEAVAGGRHVYKVQACSTNPCKPSSAYQLPLMPLLPRDTHFDDSVPSGVPVWRSSSGHLLVRPKINGKDSGGYMILDTGASGFVITQSAAVSLGLSSFGELFAASISGKVQTQFVRASSWSLGPVSMWQPVMMTMSLDGLVKGGPLDGDIIGITGYDLFRRAVVQLPQMCDAGVMQPVSTVTGLPFSGTVSTQAAKALSSHDTATDYETCGESGTAEYEQGSSEINLPSSSMHLYPQTNSSSRNTKGYSSTSRMQGQGDSIYSHPLPLIGRDECGSDQRSSSSCSSSSSSSSRSFRRSLDGSSTGLSSLDSSEEGSSLIASKAQPLHSSRVDSDRGIHQDIRSSSEGQTSRSRSGIEDHGSSSSSNKRSGRSRGSDGSRRSRVATPPQSLSLSPSPGQSSFGCPQYTMHLYDPEEFSGVMAQDWQWHTISMISNLPHLEVSFEAGSGDRASTLFMLDTGACGSDIMLHARAIEKLKMGQLGRSTTQFVRGVGGSTNTRVEMVHLPWIEVAGVRCKKVRCLYAKGISGLDISIYSAGIIGGDLLARFEVVIDYARRRLGLRKQFEKC